MPLSLSSCCSLSHDRARALGSLGERRIYEEVRVDEHARLREIALGVPFLVEYREERRHVRDVEPRPSRMYGQWPGPCAGRAARSTPEQPVDGGAERLTGPSALVLDQRGDIIVESDSGAHDV